MNQAEAVAMAQKFLAAWTSQDVEAVLATYTDDVRYRDPNTRGDVLGGAALRRYLEKLFGAWQMTWTLREIRPFAEGEGAAVLWHATFRRQGGTTVIEADGMDLVEIRDGRVSRNEVYFDRGVLTPLLDR